MAKPWDTLKHYQKAVPFTKLFAASQKIGSYCSVQYWETRLRFVSLRNAVQRLSWAVSDPSKSHCDFRVQVLLGTSTSKNNSFQRLGHYCHNTQDYIKTVDLQTLLAKSSNIQHLTLIAHDLCLWPWIKDDEMMEATSALEKWDPLSFPRINCWTHHHLLRGVLGRIGSLESWGFWSHKQNLYLSLPLDTWLAHVQPRQDPGDFFKAALKGWIWNFAIERHEGTIKQCVFAACFWDSQQHGQQQLIPEVSTKNIYFISARNFSEMMNCILPIWGFLDQSSSLYMIESYYMQIAEHFS